MYIGGAQWCCQQNPAQHDARPLSEAEFVGLGQFEAGVAAALKLGSWIAGLFRFGGKPLTGRGKKLAELAMRRGNPKQAAEGWAREWEKKLDRCGREVEEANAVDIAVSQLNPPITAPEWQELRTALYGGGCGLPPGWVPAALAVGPGPAPIPVMPGIPAPIKAGIPMVGALLLLSALIGPRLLKR